MQLRFKLQHPTHTFACLQPCAWLRNDPYWCMEQNWSICEQHECLWGGSLENSVPAPQRWSQCTGSHPLCCHTSCIHNITQTHTKQHFSLSSFWPSQRLNTNVHKTWSMSVFLPFLLYFSFHFLGWNWIQGLLKAKTSTTTESPKPSYIWRIWSDGWH